MLSLTRKSDYALVALATLAREPTPTSARAIATRYRLPLPLLMNVLKHLRRAGIVCSTRGTSGGYALCLPPDQITIASVVSAIDGPVHITPCSSRQNSEPEHCGAHETQAAGENHPPCCELGDDCPITSPMKLLNRRFNEFLGQVTLQDLLDHEAPTPSASIKDAT